MTPLDDLAADYPDVYLDLAAQLASGEPMTLAMAIDFMRERLTKKRDPKADALIQRLGVYVRMTPGGRLYKQLMDTTHLVLRVREVPAYTEDADGKSAEDVVRDLQQAMRATRTGKG
ncbi:hypothetical protein [Azospirillum canadense]|uniref:hypothetical protein n=1 Tax=Azospirillum canadense TaxID=403962 RepID=UPI0022277781|nr:hypothetical protein [Azospirillum canadense]MCW2241693.1 hypothetical protein [Azospirillum canadense]